MLRLGTYSIASSFSFSWEDSDEMWTSYPGETPVLNGSGTGSINLAGVNNLSFEGITFQNMGVGGITFDGAKNIAIRWNHFSNCTQQCISGGLLTNSIIDSNTINGQSPGNPPGSVSSAYAAIMLWYGSSNNQITHNLIQNCQGGGIAFTDGPSDPPNSNNIVDRNLLQNIDTHVVDFGALYFYDESHAGAGNQITNNTVIGNGGSQSSLVKAIYLDSITSNMLVTGNVCQVCGNFAWQIHVGNNNTLVNNIFDLSSGSLFGMYQNDPISVDHGMGNNVIQKNLLYFSEAAPANLFQVNIGSSDALPNDSGNLYWSASGSPITNGQTIVDSNPIYVNPEFSGPSSANYSMPLSSPAYILIGFQPLPTDQGPVSGGPIGSSSGALTASVTSSTTTANLTAEGTTDWAHWGTTSLTRKNGVTPQIGPWSIVGSGPANYYTNDPRSLSFTDGTAPTSATVHDGIFVNGVNGFSFTVPAGTSSHILTVHVGGYYSSGTLTAHLSDGSATDFVSTTSVFNGQYDRNYQVTYHAASAGQTLTLSWVCNTSTGNVTLNGAALK
jgi:hypothetical protein